MYMYMDISNTGKVDSVRVVWSTVAYKSMEEILVYVYGVPVLRASNEKDSRFRSQVTFGKLELRSKEFTFLFVVSVWLEIVLYCETKARMNILSMLTAEFRTRNLNYKRNESPIGLNMRASKSFNYFLQTHAHVCLLATGIGM